MFDHLLRGAKIQIPLRFAQQVENSLTQRVGVPKPATSQSREQNRNRPTVIVPIFDQALATAIDCHVDQAIIQQVAVKLGEKHLGVFHCDGILHRDDCRHAELDHPRAETRERRLLFCAGTGAMAGLEDH